MGDNARITLKDVKEHLNLTADFDLDDYLLSGYILAAIEVAQKHIGKTFADENTEQTQVFTPAIKIGCLMYIAYLYANREAVTDLANLKPAPMTISALWEVYREPCVY